MCRPKRKVGEITNGTKKNYRRSDTGLSPYLIRDEKSAVTVEKYLRDVRAFQAFIGETPVEKELVSFLYS